MSTTSEPTIALATTGLTPARYVLIPVAAVVTGYSEKALNQKIDGGVFREGHEWRRAPDGRRFIDLKNLERWIEGKQ